MIASPRVKRIDDAWLTPPTHESPRDQCCWFRTRYYVSRPLVLSYRVEHWTSKYPLTICVTALASWLVKTPLLDRADHAVRRTPPFRLCVRESIRSPVKMSSS